MNAARALSSATASPGVSSPAMREARSGLRAKSRASLTPSSIRRASRPVARKLQSISGATPGSRLASFTVPVDSGRTTEADSAITPPVGL